MKKLFLIGFLFLAGCVVPLHPKDPFWQSAWTNGDAVNAELQSLPAEPLPEGHYRAVALREIANFHPILWDVSTLNCVDISTKTRQQLLKRHPDAIVGIATIRLWENNWLDLRPGLLHAVVFFRAGNGRFYFLDAVADPEMVIEMDDAKRFCEILDIRFKPPFITRF